MRQPLTTIALGALLLSGCIFSGGGEADSNNEPNNTTSASNNETTSGSNNVTTNPPLCGNLTRDPGETCDPCPEQCDRGSDCSPVVQTGSASMCTLSCEPGLVPLGCCGDAICADGQVCDNNRCVEDPARTCDESLTPDAFCFTRFGSGYFCDRNQQVCVRQCAQDMDCVPWQGCVDDQCQAFPNCSAAMNKGDAFCAFENWRDPSEFVCMPDGDGTSTCLPTIAVLCSLGDAICKPWQHCANGGCAIPTNCNDAADKRMFCMFETGQFNTLCRPDGSCQ